MKAFIESDIKSKLNMAYKNTFNNGLKGVKAYNNKKSNPNPFLANSKYENDNVFKGPSVKPNKWKNHDTIRENLIFDSVRPQDIGTYYRPHNYAWNSNSFEKNEVVTKVMYYNKLKALRKKILTENKSGNII